MQHEPPRHTRAGRFAVVVPQDAAESIATLDMTRGAANFLARCFLPVARLQEDLSASSEPGGNALTQADQARSAAGPSYAYRAAWRIIARSTFAFCKPTTFTTG